jgi:hypothetical protein
MKLINHINSPLSSSIYTTHEHTKFQTATQLNRTSCASVCYAQNSFHFLVIDDVGFTIL